MELALMLATTLHNYRIESSNPDLVLKPVMNLLLSPDVGDKATLRFIPRE
jgi:hypothetical protein